MIKVIILILVIVLSLASSDNFPIVMNKCNSSMDVIAYFIIPDLVRLRELGFSLTDRDTISDTGSVIVYIKSLNVYYVTKRSGESVRYDGEIYKLVNYDCIDKE